MTASLTACGRSIRSHPRVIPAYNSVAGNSRHCMKSQQPAKNRTAAPPSSAANPVQQQICPPPEPQVSALWLQRAALHPALVSAFCSQDPQSSSTAISDYPPPAPARAPSRPPWPKTPILLAGLKPMRLRLLQRLRPARHSQPLLQVAPIQSAGWLHKMQPVFSPVQLPVQPPSRPFDPRALSYRRHAARGTARTPRSHARAVLALDATAQAHRPAATAQAQAPTQGSSIPSAAARRNR